MNFSNCSSSSDDFLFNIVDTRYVVPSILFLTAFNAFMITCNMLTVNTLNNYIQNLIKKDKNTLLQPPAYNV
jgi:hypothetical protein